MSSLCHGCLRDSLAQPKQGLSLFHVHWVCFDAWLGKWNCKPAYTSRTSCTVLSAVHGCEGISQYYKYWMLFMRWIMSCLQWLLCVRACVCVWGGVREREREWLSAFFVAMFAFKVTSLRGTPKTGSVISLCSWSVKEKPYFLGTPSAIP